MIINIIESVHKTVSIGTTQEYFFDICLPHRCGTAEQMQNLYTICNNQEMSSNDQFFGKSGE